ncbi:hypothetical protein ACWC10_00510 [Streptomyces sp. NPDC001595]|uniref:hypothetical protein n=1 Tax=Streptomyces sp. NPDC001532 TaxID=3154520 RepID=UPI003326A9BB
MSTTRRDLTRRLRLLLALTAATTAVLFLAYRGVHDDTVPLAADSAPGILAVDTARNAMREAHEVVRDSGPRGATGGEFHTQVSVAQQSLARAAAEDVIGVEGRHDLQTITGLIAVYSGYVELWGREPDGSPLRAAYLVYAERVLGVGAGTPTGEDILSRLGDLRDKQLDEAGRQADFPWQLWLGWSTVLLLYVALCAALLETQRYVRRRFRRPVQLRLLAATVLCAAAVPVLAWLSRVAHDAMARSVTAISAPRTDSDDIPGVAGQVRHELGDAGFWASLSDWVLLGGAVVMALTAWGLWPRISEYRFRVPR